MSLQSFEKMVKLSLHSQRKNRLFCNLGASNPTVIVRGNRNRPNNSSCSTECSRIPNACSTGSNGGFRECIADGVLNTRY